ncbi:hypothetical protein [Roseomonas indoligenes]|uniref:Uncharacterized protein n=1 Tax=Roseomonas indoligenes TaxID=2820811 RepID=A0A940S6N2_9PROT|nr:hypothetical protein [Pararoseomonas indoligenes]MBP0492222.1 hypothetical protein [Pararoseomonas indoligenes]
MTAQSEGAGVVKGRGDGLKLGDYVTATCPGVDGPRQGVITTLNANWMILEGQIGTYVAKRKGAVLVPDVNLWGDALKHVQQVRALLTGEPARAAQVRGEEG